MEIQEIRTFGRRHGKKISKRQQWLVDNLLPLLNPYSILLQTHPVGFADTTQSSEIALQSQIPNPQSHILEIGFGAGEHIRELALQNPDKIILGAEPFMNGVASLLSRITRQESVECKVLRVELLNKIILPEYKNIRIWPDDVRKLLNPTLHAANSTLQNINFKEIYILHPDPWPKARHEKRRLLNSDFLNLLSQRLEKDGRIIIGTDHWEYYEWIVEQLKKTKLKISTTDLGIIETRYKQKNKAKTTNPKYLVLSI